MQDCTMLKEDKQLFTSSTPKSMEIKTALLPFSRAYGEQLQLTVADQNVVGTVTVNVKGLSLEKVMPGFFWKPTTSRGLNTTA